jgi:hypothetical protein
MRKYHTGARRSSDTITGIAEATAERVMLSGEILKALAEAVARHEKTQQKFRTAVLIRLANIETIVQMIHGGVIFLGRRHGDGSFYGDDVERDAKAAEEFISRKSQELGLKMVKYIYGESEEQSTPAKRGRKRRDSAS